MPSVVLASRFLIASMLWAVFGGALADARDAAGLAGALPQLSALESETPHPLQMTTVRIWPGAAPMAAGPDGNQVPTLTILRPQVERPGSAAVIIVPGGGYVGLASTLEGTEPAAWFTSRGIVAFILTYRVRPSASVQGSLLDGARAMRFVRAHATEFGIDPHRIGMMGFSAGGHLAASIAATAAPGAEDDPDPVARADDRPDFLILAYPWLEATRIDPEGTSPYCAFSRYLRVTTNCDPSLYAGLTPIDHVTKAMPPTFIVHTTDDSVVPVDGSVRMYERLAQLGVDTELHVFASGPHGMGMGGAYGSALAKWPEMLDAWLRMRGHAGVSR